MSALQVPPSSHSRRRRRVDDEDEDEQSTRATTPLSQSSTGSKRMRLEGTVGRSDDENEDEDDAGPSEAKIPLSRSALPAGYSTHGDFHPGAIVRMKLKDFVTYTNVEYFFGPQLNMIIGPNGTGKSTLVCAICLGLGWGPQVSACTVTDHYLRYELALTFNIFSISDVRKTHLNLSSTDARKQP